MSFGEPPRTMRRTPQAVICTLLALSTGCLADDGALTPAHPPSPEAIPSVETPAADSPAPEDPRDIPVHAEATLRTAAAVCPPMTRAHCVEPLGAAAYGEEAWIDGVVSALRANVTWTPTSALTESLELWLGVCWGETEAYECETLVVAEGPSPLVAQAQPARTDAGYYYVVVTTASTGATADARASTQQPFTLDGLITATGTR